MNTKQLAMVISAALLGLAAFVPVESARADGARMYPQHQTAPQGTQVNRQAVPRMLPQPNMNQIQVPRTPNQTPAPYHAPFRGPNPGE